MNKPIWKLKDEGGVSRDHGQRPGIWRVLGRAGWLAAAARLQELETEDSKERSLD